MILHGTDDKRRRLTAGYRASCQEGARAVPRLARGGRFGLDPSPLQARDPGSAAQGADSSGFRFREETRGKLDLRIESIAFSDTYVAL